MLAVLVLGACEATVTPEPVPSSASPTSSASATPNPTAAASPSATGTPEPSAGIAVPEPGRPWDGAALLREMADSTRPDGVPASLRTAPIAEALADAIWTVDGATWDTFAIGGFCGTTSCTVEVAGTHLGRAGEDLWVLQVDPAGARVDVLDADVRSLPPELVEQLDGLARASIDLEGMVLGTARWLPPPTDPGRFGLSYRSGGEEGSCRRDLVLDAGSGEVVEETAAGC